MAVEEFSGYWWLPEEPDHKLSGKLTFSSQEGLELNLNGIFDEKSACTPLGTNILGETSFGEKITIYQAFYTGSERVITDEHPGASSYISQRGFVGHHFHTMEDTKFIRVAYHPTHLDEWLSLPIMEFEYQEDGFSIRYTRPESLSFHLAEEISIRILFSSYGPKIGSTVTKLDFQHKAYLSIELEKEQHFSHFGELLFHLNNFFALAVMQPVQPRDLEGEVLIDDPETGKSATRLVRILQPLFDQSDPQKIYRCHMLFTYNDIEEKLGEYLKNWFGKREHLNPVFDLFFGVLQYSSYPVTTFLNYAQALETYHIRTKSNDIDPPDVHRKRIKAILSSVPEEYREWVQPRISFGNSPTFAQRLHEVIDINPRPVSGMAGSHQVFVKRVRDSRNYYTHYNPSLEKKAARGGRLKGLSNVLGSMLEGVLLLEAGFSLDNVQKMQSERRLLPSAWY